MLLHWMVCWPRHVAYTNEVDARIEVEALGQPSTSSFLFSRPHNFYAMGTKGNGNGRRWGDAVDSDFIMGPTLRLVAHRKHKNKN